MAPGEVPTAGTAPIGVADKAKMDSEVSKLTFTELLLIMLYLVMVHMMFTDCCVYVYIVLIIDERVR